MGIGTLAIGLFNNSERLKPVVGAATVLLRLYEPQRIVPTDKKKVINNVVGSKETSEGLWVFRQVR